MRKDNPIERHDPSCTECAYDQQCIVGEQNALAMFQQTQAKLAEFRKEHPQAGCFRQLMFTLFGKK